MSSSKEILLKLKASDWEVLKYTKAGKSYNFLVNADLYNQHCLQRDMAADDGSIMKF
jgi:hypothetical protein